MFTSEPRWDNWAGKYEYGSEYDIEIRKGRYKAKKQEIENLQYEYDLIEQDLVKTYKENVSYEFMFVNQNADAAQKWLHTLEDGIAPDGKKRDRRRKYPEQKNYNWLVEQLTKYLGEGVELTAIYDFNFGQSKEYLFNYKGYKFQLDVPILKGCDIKKFQHYGETIFQLSLAYRPKEHFIEHFYYTFEEDTLKEALDNKVKELEEKKDDV